MKNDERRGGSSRNRGDCRATSPEALIGYLYLTGREDRVAELMRRALPEEYAEGTHEE